MSLSLCQILSSYECRNYTKYIFIILKLTMLILIYNEY